MSSAMKNGGRRLSLFSPAAEGYRLCPWMNTRAFGRDVAPLGREVGCQGPCPWGSTITPFEGKSPRFDETVFIDPTARLIGDIVLESGVSI